MIKILTIIGARPQIIKASALSRSIKNKFSDKIQEVILHTGQHYDDQMSKIFFDELKIPKPDYNLNVGSSSHGKQTALMIQGIEDVLLKEKPDVMILYGDTNSTLAGAVAGSKLHIPIAHIEAGLRSFNKSMPEEINRIMCDHVSTYLFTPTTTAVENLKSEGFNVLSKPEYNIDNPCISNLGDVMYDNSMHFSSVAEEKSSVLQKYNLEKNNFITVTIHRDNNTDNPKRLNSIFKAIDNISKENNIDIIIPLHPRTSKILKERLSEELYAKIINNKFLKIIPPVSFFDMIMLEKNSKLIVTDSGGVQKEAYFYKKPCVILRSETEWVEIIKNKAGIIADAEYNKIINSVNYFMKNNDINFQQVFGNANAAELICEKILKDF